MKIMCSICNHFFINIKILLDPAQRWKEVPSMFTNGFHGLIVPCIMGLVLTRPEKKCLWNSKGIFY